MVLTPGAVSVKSSLHAAIADSGSELAAYSREGMQELYDELIDVEFRLKKLDTKIRQLCRHNEICKRAYNVFCVTCHGP